MQDLAYKFDRRTLTVWVRPSQPNEVVHFLYEN